MSRCLGLGLAITMVMLAACSGSGQTADDDASSAAVRVSSFDFAESELLAEVYAQVIESAGAPVQRLGAVGPREIVAPALELGQIDFVPEYLGTLLQYLGSESTEADTVSAGQELVERLEPRGLTALEPSSAQDKNVFVITAETAAAFELRTISDLTRVALDFRFGGPPECVERPLCLAGLGTVYGIRFAEFVPQRSLDFTAESLLRGEIEVGLLFSTSVQLRGDNLVILTDDQGLQPAENVVPIVRSDALARLPADVVAAIDETSRLLTTTDLRRLNQQVADGASVVDVGHGWLIERGLSNEE
ncbi:MAG: ABC transporter substrate-binding protein [Acidimicrobiales bacterium]